MKPDPRNIRDARLRGMEAERIVTWSPSLQRWCVCNGIAKVLFIASTYEEAEKYKNQAVAEQLKLF